MDRVMKNSGIPWIGLIPEDWEITTIGRLFIAKAGGDAKPELYSEEPDIYHPYPVYTNSSDKNQIYAYTSVPVFDENTITVTGRGEIGRAIYRETKYDAIIRLIALSPKEKLEPRFYTYWIDNVVPFFSDSAAIGQLSAKQIQSYKTCVLNIEEQEKIADYLDTKCAAIDAAIEKTQSSIEEYKRLKQAIITQAVTKGVRGDRPMKNSGIDWVGNIPEDWSVQRIKTIFSMRNERNDLPLSEVNLISLYTDRGVVQHSDLEHTTGNKASNADGYKKVYKNDIIVNIILCWMGAIGRSEYDGVTSPAYDIYVPSDEVDCRYYHYYFRTSGFSGDCYKNGRGIMAMRWRTYSDEFRSIKVAVPPLQEQTEIADYLDEECASIDNLFKKKEQLITELESYKKSLIYEYVTGKKEVC